MVTRRTVFPGADLDLKDPNRNSEITEAQVYDLRTIEESRLPKNYGDLTPERIRAIRLDPTVSFLRELTVAPAIHSPWTVEATKKAPREAKELIESVFLPHRMDLITGSLLGALDFGWQPYELVYGLGKRNRAVITKFKRLLQDYTWIAVYEDTGAYAGLVNQALWGFEEALLLDWYSMNITLEVEGTDWYGRSISEVIDATDTQYSDVNSSANRYDKKVAGSHWIIYYPVGKTLYENTYQSNDVIAKKVLQSLEANGAVAIPDEIQEFMEDTVDHETKGKWRIELLSDTSSTATSFQERLKYLDALKCRAFGIPERAVLEGKFGTKAEAESHADVAVMTLDTKHRRVVRQYNDGPVNHLLRLNYGEKAVDTVFLQVAPIVDTRLSVIREVYRLIIQGASADMAGRTKTELVEDEEGNMVEQEIEHETTDNEIDNLDLDAMRDMLGLPSANNRQIDS